MRLILPKERYNSEKDKIIEKYLELLSILKKNRSLEDEENSNYKNWLKLKNSFIKMKKCYSGKKTFTMGALKVFRFKKLIFQNEYRALVIKAITLLEKLLWHKKINKLD
jgi:hypothetical protein